MYYIISDANIFFSGILCIMYGLTSFLEPWMFHTIRPLPTCSATVLSLETLSRTNWFSYIDKLQQFSQHKTPLDLWVLLQSRMNFVFMNVPSEHWLSLVIRHRSPARNSCRYVWHFLKIPSENLFLLWITIS